MSKYTLVRQIEGNPFERLVQRVSTLLMVASGDYNKDSYLLSLILKDLETVEELEPSFIPKLAFYTRQQLNLRSVSNFILAWSATKKRTHQTLKEFFTSCIVLPSDLMDFVNKFQSQIELPNKLKIPTFLKKLIKKKLLQFSMYQLGKYCSEAKRKRQLIKDDNVFSLKKLVIHCNIKEPKMLVAAIVGKKYPDDPESFQETGFGTEEEFNADLAKKRMRIKTPFTWETEISNKGNKAENWEKLVKENKLPYMALVRNIQNLLITGVDKETHDLAASKISNIEAVQKSRLFPFQFLSAHDSLNVDLSHLEKLKSDPDYKFKDERLVEKDSNRLKNIHQQNRQNYNNYEYEYDSDGRYYTTKSELNKKRKVIIPKEVPSQEVLDNYKSSLDEALKYSAMLNIDPIRGKTVIFCDVSHHMRTPLSSKSMKKYDCCSEVGIIFGLMCKSVSEECDLYYFPAYGDYEEHYQLRRYRIPYTRYYNQISYDGYYNQFPYRQYYSQIPYTEQFGKWTKVELADLNIFDTFDEINKEIKKYELSDRNFPLEWFEDAISEKKWIDTFIMFSNLEVNEFSSHQIYEDSNRKYTNPIDVINDYRNKVNPDMRFVLCNLSQSAGQLNGVKFGKDFRNVRISGYSDSILQFISTSGMMQSEIVRNSEPLN